MKIAFVAAECLPFVKTGGLADVGFGLTKALAKLGHEVIVFMPKYENIIYGDYELKHEKSFNVDVNFNSIFCGLDSCYVGDVKYIFIDNEEFFNRSIAGGYYGHGDDGFRFGFFDRAVLDAFGHLNWYPDICHINDWHTGLIPHILNTEHRYNEKYKNIKVVLTIHNLKFQGWFEKDLLNQLDVKYDDSLIMGDSVNFLKAAITNVAVLNTVSETYKNATLGHFAGEGLENILSMRSVDYYGILNGIDDTFFSPNDNTLLYKSYNKNDCKSGKLENKLSLKQNYGLADNSDRPLYVMISRLTSQKGMDLVINNLESILSENLDLMILGDGEEIYVEKLNYLSSKYDNFNFYKGYNEELAHKLYAGADFLLMPSLFEPCGLSQIIALNFGTIPIVHDVDGLHDTILAYNEFSHTGNGLKFSGFTNEIFTGIIRYAQFLFYNYDHRVTLVENAFASDFSFDNQVNNYLKLYDS